MLPNKAEIFNDSQKQKKHQLFSREDINRPMTANKLTYSAQTNDPWCATSNEDETATPVLTKQLLCLPTKLSSGKKLKVISPKSNLPKSNLNHAVTSVFNPGLCS